MKKIVAILLAVLMMLPAFAMAENVVKIGVFEPASGDSGAGGKQEMLGMQYANYVQPTVEIGDAARDSAYIKTANTETGAWDFVTVQTVE